MLTGVEVAGLVLAAVPIILTALEHYREGFESIKIAKNYLHHLRALQREVKIQLSIFRHTLEHLLENAVSTRQLRSLLREPDGQLWHEPDIQRRLASFLGVSYEPFCETTAELREIVVELQYNFDNGCNLNKGLPPGKPFWAREFDRIKFCLGKEKRNQLKARMRDCNKIMRDLTMDNVALLSTRANRKLQAVDYSEIRDNAIGVHEALDSAPWCCRCKTPHNANLRLESRIPSMSPKNLPLDNVRDLDLKFRVLFQSDSDHSTTLGDWRETDIVPVKLPIHSRVETTQADTTNHERGAIAPPDRSLATRQSHSDRPLSANPATSSTTVINAPPAKKARKSVRWDPDLDTSLEELAARSVDLHYQHQNLQNIANLCALLQEVTEGKGCLGILTARQRQQQFTLLAIKRHPRQQAEKNILRLHDVLTNSISLDSVTTSIPSPYYTLSGIDKRYLAVCLASSVLQLYRTPWLLNDWGRHEIFFVREISESGRPMVRQPFVSRAYGGRKSICQPQSQKALAKLPCIRNKTVFDLGILLIELWFCTPLQAMRTTEDLKDGLPNILTDFFTAERLQKRVKYDAGTNWADAIRRCIYCEFDQHDTSLENEDFRQAVYQGVVLPLCGDLRYFCGKKIPALD